MGVVHFSGWEFMKLKAGDLPPHGCANKRYQGIEGNSVRQLQKNHALKLVHTDPLTPKEGMLHHLLENTQCLG